MTELNKKEKIKSIVELNQQLASHLEHAQALLRVALEASDFVKLPTDTQYDFLSVVDDKINSAVDVHDKILTLSNQDSFDSVCG